LGEPVLVAVGTLGVLAPLEHAVVDQRLEALGEKRPGRTGASLEVLEATGAHEGLPQHHHRPAVADHGQGPSDRALLLVDLAPTHSCDISRIAFRMRTEYVLIMNASVNLPRLKMRALQLDDAERARRPFGRLSSETVYRRYFTFPPRLMRSHGALPTGVHYPRRNRPATRSEG